MAGTLWSARRASAAPRGAAFLFVSQGLRRLERVAGSSLLSEIASASVAEANAYLLGAAHDSTFSRRHGTTRYCQADREWLEVLGELLAGLGTRSWIYREGRFREVWVLECSWRPPGDAFSDVAARRAYARGYFDAEGGVPRSPKARFYIQLVQKDRGDLEQLRDFLVQDQIRCGRLHNPSRRADPEYWRFYVAAGSHRRFIRQVGSWHPRKRARLELEMSQNGAGRPLKGAKTPCRKA